MADALESMDASALSNKKAESSKMLTGTMDPTKRESLGAWKDVQNLAADPNAAQLSCTKQVAIGDDEYGELFTKSFRDKETISFKKTEYRTGVCLIFVTPDGNRTMAANLGANTQLNSDCLDFEQLSNAEFLVFDNFTLSAISNFDDLKFLYECPEEIKICFGVSDVSLVDENLDLLNQLSQLKLFLIYGNIIEIRALQKKLQFDPENILQSEGENGAMFNQLKVNAPDIIPVNTNGAGDALVGTFLAKYKELSTEICLKQAVEYASKVCCEKGPRLI